MIKESELLKAIVRAGLTFSPEKDDGYVMRNCQASEVVRAIIEELAWYVDEPIMMDCD